MKTGLLEEKGVTLNMLCYILYFFEEFEKKVFKRYQFIHRKRQCFDETNNLSYYYEKAFIDGHNSSMIKVDLFFF